MNKMTRTNKLYLYCLLLVLTAALSGCSDDLLRANDQGSQLTEEGNFRLSTFPLYEELWNIPDSVLCFDLVLWSHTDDSELRFEATCEHLYGMNYISIRIPDGQSIPDSDYDMRGYLKNGDILNKRITVTFRDEMLCDILGIANAYALKKGQGTESDPYLIESSTDFTYFLNGLKGDDTRGKGLYFKQTKHFKAPPRSADIPSEYYRGEEFAGHYDGDGHIVTVLFTGGAESTSDDFVGLFTKLLDGATIDNLTVNANISGVRNKGGALAGAVIGNVTVSNVNMIGFILDSKTEIGGLVGAVHGTLKVTNFGLGSADLGGEELSSIVTGCTVKGTEKVGGIVGNAVKSTVIINTVTNINFEEPESVDIEGSVGKVGSMIGNAENCTVEIKNVTLDWPVLSASLKTRKILGEKGVGGLIGEALINGASAISGCKIAAPVRGNGDYIGGLIGKTMLNAKLTVSDSHVTAPVIGGQYVGGFFGHITSRGNLTFTKWGNYTTTIGEEDGGDIVVHGNESVGGMFGYLEGNFNTSGNHDINVNVTAGGKRSGGIVGYLKECKLDATRFELGESMLVVGKESVGGLVGYAEGCTITGGVKEDKFVFDMTVPAASGFGSSYKGIVQCDTDSKTGTGMGGIVGTAAKTSISHICCTGTVKGATRVGGIVGYLNNKDGGSMNYCVSNMRDIDAAGDAVGGIAGRIETKTAQYNYMINYTKVTGKNQTGGVIGHAMPLGTSNTFTLNYAVNTGTISGTVNVGGIIGYLSYDKSNYDGKAMKVINCGNYGDISNSGTGNVGGIMGHGDRKQMYVMYCANHGSVTGGSKPSKVGGIIGRIGHDAATFSVQENLELAYCCNTGTINAKNKKSHVGGLAGYQEEGYTGDAFHWRTHDCYNAGKVIATGLNDDAGGVLGCIDHIGHISRCINIGKVSQGNGVLGTHRGAYSASDLYYLDGTANGVWEGTKFYNADKRKPEKFKNFDFNMIWIVNDLINDGFPYLRECPFQFVTYKK